MKKKRVRNNLIVIVIIILIIVVIDNDKRFKASEANHLLNADYTYYYKKGIGSQTLIRIEQRSDQSFVIVSDNERAFGLMNSHASRSLRVDNNELVSSRLIDVSNKEHHLIGFFNTLQIDILSVSDNNGKPLKVNLVPKEDTLELTAPHSHLQLFYIENTTEQLYLKGLDKHMNIVYEHHYARN